MPRELFVSSMVAAGVVLLAQAGGWGAEPTAWGNATLRGPYGDSEIVITTTARLAGAIHSLTWNGQEFVDSADHGRQIQSASNFDAGSSITSETYNPTEAGSRNDGAGPRSSSKLLHMVVGERSLQTTTQMAFWLAPGHKSGPNLAKNRTVLSQHLLTKRVSIGYRGLANVIVYDATFHLPVGEDHQHAVFEACTGYMPSRFSDFYAYSPTEKKLQPLSDGPGEQGLPVVLATSSGSHAMGVISPQQPSRGFEKAGYGRFRFGPEKVVKWNCVFRLRTPGKAIPPGEYSYRNWIVLGTRRDVEKTLAKLADEIATEHSTQPGQHHIRPATD